MAGFFLNPLDLSNRQLVEPIPGTWASDKDFLSKYAHDIATGGQLADLHEVHSLPSVFARPIQFWQALNAGHAHPLYEATISEWRGLLAVFALREWLDITPVALRFDVPQLDQIGAGADRNFHTILRNQLPKPEADWDHWWLLKCNGQLIGATSPWTMVYTPTAYSCPATIPWRDDEGLLIDPIKYYDPQGVGGTWFELALLLRWVQLVRLKFPWDIQDNVKAGVMNRELQAWEAALKRYEDSALAVSALEQPPAIAAAPYSHFLMPPQIAAPAAGPTSNLLLSSSKQPRTLVLPRSGLETKQRVYQSVLVDQVALTEKNLPGPTGNARWQTGKGRTIPLPYIIPEEAFFPQKLVQLQLSNNARISNGQNQYATPLTPLFFKYFDHKNLPMLTMADTGPGIQASLKLPLANGGSHTVTKIYDKQTQIVHPQYGVPALAVWPDFYDSGWRENFALFSAVPDTDLLVAPLASDGTQLGTTVEDGTQKPLRIWQSTRPLLGFVLHHQEQPGKLIESGLVVCQREVEG